MLKAILFDLDGTLANTDPLHYETWKEILNNHGVIIDHNSYKQHISGRTNPAIIQDLLPHLSTTEVEELADYKEAKFREIATNLEPMRGLLEFIEWVKNQKLQKAVVTNAPPENAEFMLDVLQLTDTFPLVILGGVMTVAKPDPAPYKLCLEKLEISPEEAIVFEDSRSGIKSAVGAGIYTVGVASTHEPESLLEVGASIVINDFSDEKLQQLLDSWNISGM
ncbi:MAG: HAD family phosphatase [Okeania sp. SIO2G4]|uniref:HAD family hydrolase n=1 Tax=unclassified Okeania TaxID=2634635 RepID=UPI0013B6DFA7|nr:MULTISPECIES: HAD family phosphatase [unclassified Okeania]NEP03632.1 HAD family phosphatase [Okeania sp. SIO4D6]NEP43957.1 HAD family phosphatase [Okeania sp. SIO2H7]NEP73800.1 HAD family phosphatase [Okeania sp. SIO2G5]NEP94460.1 HAD family phosphatase [Okeania sp. SIO2F5]NEQ93092.1 HAD family phosphatase [Okeania sp. SIO2G4]